MIKRIHQKPGQGMTLSPNEKHPGFAFQGPSSAQPSVLALEGLFTTLCEHLEQLTQVRTDYPCDHLARCKAAFTDRLIHELEASNYHSPAFDRLIQLRDAWDCGTLDLPNVTEQNP